MTNKIHLRILSAALAVSALLASASLLFAQNRAEPEVKITEVPPSATGGPDEMFPIAGAVSGVDSFKDYRVVIYVFAGGKWYVQPFDYAALTEIKSSGKFETETHGGSIYAVLLVRPSYKPRTPLSALPDGPEILAKIRVPGKKEQ